LRVIAGRYKGRRLKPPTWQGLRPTSDKLRETFFNVVAGRIEGARFLDGYSGTGAVGIEALSRGAAHVTFVEADRRAVRLIEENLRGCGVTADYTIHPADLPGTLRRLQPAAFDLIWLDPPYDIANVSEILEHTSNAVDPAGLIVLERATRREPIVPATLRRLRDLRSGDSTLTFFTRAA
jgi:16S rRNA (guanine(966)-N(2))-methyltransferase RsmD